MQIESLVCIPLPQSLSMVTKETIRNVPVIVVEIKTTCTIYIAAHWFEYIVGYACALCMHFYMCSDRGEIISSVNCAVHSIWLCLLPLFAQKECSLNKSDSHLPILTYTIAAQQKHYINLAMAKESSHLFMHLKYSNGHDHFCWNTD